MDYVHSHQKSVGGVEWVGFTPADNVAGLPLSLHDPRLVWQVRFAEGAARYREQTEAVGGVPTVVHTLEFYTDRIDRRSDGLLRRLSALSPRGLAAVVTTATGVRLLVGFSQEHGAERPLRLEQVSADTGRLPADRGGELVCLCSRDTAKAAVLE